VSVSTRARIVADALAFTNEIKFDQGERWLYAVETAARRISRFPVREDRPLGDRETFGPAALGPGFRDGPRSIPTGMSGVQWSFPSG
jgi:sugar lactone lactonase YvrE